MKELKKIHDLLNKAGHPNTPTEEARTCALKAAQLFHKYNAQENVKTKYVIVKQIPKDEVEIPISKYPEDPWQDAVRQNIDLENVADWAEMKTHRVRPAKEHGNCKSCGKHYDRHEQVAYVEGSGATHYKCRMYWINGGV